MIIKILPCLRCDEFQEKIRYSKFDGILILTTVLDLPTNMFLPIERALNVDYIYANQQAIKFTPFGEIRIRIFLLFLEMLNGNNTLNT